MLSVRRRIVGILAALVAAAVAPVAARADIAEIRIAYITEQAKPRAPLSPLDSFITDEGVQGARLGIQDSNTTGRFTNQHFSLDEALVPAGGDVAGAFKKLVASGHQLVVADLPMPQLLAVADLPEAKNTLIFNVQAKDDALRGEQCRANLLHTVPSRAMLTDALAQYLIWKRWNQWFLVYGKGAGDHLFADAIRRSAKKFGAKIVEDREYDASSTAPHTDSGNAQIQKQIPLLTQGPDYQVLVVADESDLFGEYLPYRTWQPRPVVGTQGLVPTGWHRSNEQWGALQFQDRFGKFAKRWMTERDYAAWLAVRSISEAATRTKATDYATLDAFIRGKDFDLAGFKGQKLTYRDWDGQLRQPILLASARMLVSVSPQEGFLHEHSELDTLGTDRPESTCKLK